MSLLPFRNVPDAVIAVIPARGGSKGIPHKNLREVGGRPLIARAVDTCVACPAIDLVVVSTDDDAIAGAARAAGAEIVERPTELSGDAATSESALLHALTTLRDRGMTPDVLVFVQATSPFIDPDDIAEAVEQVRAGELDVVFAAVETYEFLWARETQDDGSVLVQAVNHEAAHRPRRQDREPHWRETGAFYVMDAAGFAAAGHRFFGRLGVAPVAERDAIEIDTPEQLKSARRTATPDAPGTAPLSPAMAARLAGVRVLVTDFDGVHTDDRAVVADDGSESVIVSRADGHGIKLLRHAGIPMLILSTETNGVVGRRAEKLGVECLQGIDDKWTALQHWLQAHDLGAADAAYVGNDVNDLECMAHVGLPIAVADADPIVRAAAAHVTTRRGGRGAVREIADLLAEHRTPAGGYDVADRHQAKIPRPTRQGASL